MVEAPWPPLSNKDPSFPRGVFAIILIAALFGLMSFIFSIQNTATSIRDDRIHNCIVRILLYYSEVPPDDRTDRQLNKICPDVARLGKRNE